jgi:hypothetical protein
MSINENSTLSKSEIEKIISDSIEKYLPKITSAVSSLSNQSNSNITTSEYADIESLRTALQEAQDRQKKTSGRSINLVN